jgi:hypothetical protein
LFDSGRGGVDALVDAPYAFEERPSWVPKSHPAETNKTTWIINDNRYVGEFTTILQMEDFPYDRQSVILWIESFYDVNQVKIELAEPWRIHDVVPDYMPEIVGWDRTFNSQKKTIQLYDYNGAEYDRLVVEVHVKRQPGYFLSKIVTGVLLLNYMGFFIFSMGAHEGNDIGGGLSVYAAIVGYLFVLGEDVPKVPYQTRLDVFMLFSFFIAMICVFGKIQKHNNNDKQKTFS